MKIAVTGCNGSVGKRVVIRLLESKYQVLGIDISPPESDAAANLGTDFTFLALDLKDYAATLTALTGCDAVVHLAAFRDPGDYQVATHNSNIVTSWNVLRAAAELGINRVAQASSVNVITMVYSKEPALKFFPIDESHPCEPDEPYGLSKVICELQAETLVRRYPNMRIASLRLHWSVPRRSAAQILPPSRAKNDLWGYVQEDSAADAFLRAITVPTLNWPSAAEAFFIVAPDSAFDGDSRSLREEHWPHVPLKEGKDVSGSAGFFDCQKAKDLLGWVHVSK